MTTKRLEFVRWGIVLVLGVIVGIMTGWTVETVDVAWGCSVLSMLGDVSAILFGVFGIWLGMFYRPDVCDAIKGKADEELLQTARQIIANARRFEIVFRGMKISALVLVFSMVSRTIREPASGILSTCGLIPCVSVKFVFFYFVYSAMLLQGYAIVMSIVPMLDARRKVVRAKEDAELALSL